jgi:hypothetical protein
VSGDEHHVIALADHLQRASRRASADIQKMVEQMNEIAELALWERNAARELAETWASISCNNSIRIGQLEADVLCLKRHLKEALDFLAGFDHKAALAIRIAAEGI